MFRSAVSKRRLVCSSECQRAARVVRVNRLVETEQKEKADPENGDDRHAEQWRGPRQSAEPLDQALRRHLNRPAGGAAD
jgi:hypothetical protein